MSGIETELQLFNPKLQEVKGINPGDQLADSLFDFIATPRGKLKIVFAENYEILLDKTNSDISLSIKRGNQLKLLTAQLSIKEQKAALSKMTKENADIIFALTIGDNDVEDNISSQTLIDALNASAQNYVRIDISGRGLLIDQGVTGFQMSIQNNDLKMFRIQYNGQTISEYQVA